MDILKGEAGDDQIKGGDADDLIEGGVDNDRLYGQSGSDKIFGDDGNDEGRPDCDCVLDDADDVVVDEEEAALEICPRISMLTAVAISCGGMCVRRLWEKRC